jgi:hypothetical protein
MDVDYYSLRSGERLQFKTMDERLNILIYNPDPDLTAPADALYVTTQPFPVPHIAATPPHHRVRVSEIRTLWPLRRIYRSQKRETPKTRAAAVEGVVGQAVKVPQTYSSCVTHNFHPLLGSWAFSSARVLPGSIRSLLGPYSVTWQIDSFPSQSAVNDNNLDIPIVKETMSYLDNS